jgi:hypothetical protein
MSNSVKKWSPVLQITNIKNEYWDMVADYCEREYEKNPDHDKNLLPMQLKILSKIDLSRVDLFSDDIDDDIFKTDVLSIKVNHSDMYNISNKIGIDVIDRIEHAMIEEMSNIYNTIINNKAGVIIKNVCMGLEHDIEHNKIILKYRFIPLGDYRQLKLKKISERN